MILDEAAKFEKESKHWMKMAEEESNLSQQDDTSIENEKEQIRKDLKLKLTLEKENVQWSDIIGIKEAKEELKVAVVQQVEYPHCYESGQLIRYKGIMLFG
jgi:SpoVK/Ycf46/Vps4 family AAA+-type ATPase